MFFSVSFPLEKNPDVPQLEKKLKRINRFFTMKASLSGKYRAFGVQVLTSIDENHIEDPPEYYILFKFFNAYKERQKKLELLYSIGFNKELYEKIRIDICALSFISSLPLYSVAFSYDVHNLNIATEFSDEYGPALHSYLAMLFNNFKEAT